MPGPTPQSTETEPTTQGHVEITITLSSAKLQLLKADLPVLPKFSATRALVSELIAAAEGADS